MAIKSPVICVILLVLLFGCGTIFSQEAREVRKTVELNKDGEVYIDTYKGSITIDTWDKPEVEIYAKIEPDGWDRHSREKVRNTEIRIDDSPNRVRIKSDYEEVHSHSSWFFGLFDDNSGSLPFVYYTITMPSTAHLRIKDYKSESKISDLASSVNMETYKGRVDFKNLNGSVDLETYKGEVHVEFTKMRDDSRFETYKGNIDITMPKNAGFALDADIGRHADLHSDFDISVRSRHRDEERYHTSMNGGGPLLRISTEKGDIRLKAR